MTKLPNNDIINMLDKLDTLIKNKDLTLTLHKNSFGLKTKAEVNKYIRSLDKKDKSKGTLFNAFIKYINIGLRYVVNENPEALEKDILEEIKQDKDDNITAETTETNKKSDEILDLNNYDDYKGENLRDYVYSQLASYTLEIINNSYGNIKQELKLISKENFILKSIKHDITTHRDKKNITEVDLYAIKLFFEIENLDTEKFEFEITYDDLNNIIKELSDIKDKFEQVKDS